MATNSSTLQRYSISFFVQQPNGDPMEHNWNENNNNTHFILDGEIDKVGIYQYPVWWPQCCVVFEVKCRRNLGPNSQ